MNPAKILKQTLDFNMMRVPMIIGKRKFPKRKTNGLLFQKKQMSYQVSRDRDKCDKFYHPQRHHFLKKKLRKS